MRFVGVDVGWRESEYQWRQTTVLHELRQPSYKAETYMGDIVEPYSVPYVLLIEKNFVYMRDRARPRVAKCVCEYLEASEIQNMRSLAPSPELNP